MRNSFYQRKKAFYVRFTAMICIISIVMGLFVVKLTELQLINADTYLAQADTSSTRIQTVTAARGEIVDRYGRVLVYNRTGSNIVLNAATLPSSQINSTILKLVKLMQSTENEWRDKLPLATEAPYGFVEEMQAEGKTLRTTLGLAHYATAKNCFDAMVTRYKLEGMTEYEQRLIMGVRYSMERADYSVANPFCFAEDINAQAISAIKESAYEFEGVEVATANFREYTDSSLAPHILGYTGLISDTEWEKLKDSGEYRLNDYIGKDGIEKAAEEYLHGVDGKIKITTNASGVVTESEVVTPAVAGNTVQLTLDMDLQKAAQKALADAIGKINANAVYSTQLATGGAVVVINVKDGGILAAANYPTYTYDDFFSDYSSLLTANEKPLFNRALMGAYPPGSTFKPAVALAGLELSAIKQGEAITCVHKYTRFADYQPSCLGTHGPLGVSTALAKSCNYFFYELGYRIGITNLNNYCRQLGLGASTGVELAEYTGTLAGKEAREAAGGIWNPGDTIQAAIGQSDNAFTPLQMAVYTSTIATGGQRYKAHFMQAVYDYSISELKENNFSEVLSEASISESTFNTVREGMLQVSEDGTASATFGNYPIKVAGKTGTADAYKKTNAMFIAFAPYEEPEIAIAIAVENGGHGSAVAPIAKQVFDAYFFQSGNNYSESQINALLK